MINVACVAGDSIISVTSFKEACNAEYLIFQLNSLHVLRMAARRREQMSDSCCPVHALSIFRAFYSCGQRLSNENLKWRRQKESLFGWKRFVTRERRV